jgi:SNF2 family DNA or RNA helicase
MNSMAIIKTKCPICKKSAVISSERQIAGQRVLMYQCGHADIQRQMSKADFTDFVSSDGKRPYNFQIEGALFGIESNANCLIADEMGLGKTVQFIMIVKSHQQELCKFLLVCKAGLKIQMQKECTRWGGEDFIAQIIESENDYPVPGVKGYILSFDTLWRFKDIAAFVQKLKIKTLVMDEVQHLKNSAAKRTNGVREVAKLVSHRIALSGTPISNHAGEYFPILNILRPDKFRTLTEFSQIHVDTYWSGHAMKYGGLKDADRFKRYTSDFIIRRTRAEVLPDLPSISRDFRFCELGDKVESAYKDTFKQFQQYYNSSGSDLDFVRQSNILAYLSKMRHLTGVAKIEPCIQFLEEFIDTTDRKIVVFTHHIDVAKKLFELLSADKNMGHVLMLPADTNLRQNTIDEFKDTKSARILLASTLASGEGLNMQFCADCIMLERQWTPIKEEQAEARFPRPGQTADKINATYFVAVGTVDEFLAKIVEQKRAIMANTLDGKDYKWNESSIIKELAEALAATGGKQWGW